MSLSPSSNAYALLHLPRVLAIEVSALDEAYHRVLRRDDAVGADASLNEAREVLADPARRVRHWLELHGWSQWQAVPLSDEFMSFFSGLGPVLHEAQELSRQLEQASTALGRARLAARVLGLRRRLEACSTKLQALQAPMLEALVRFDQLSDEQQQANLAALAMEQARWAYLSKWRSQITQAMGRLFF